MVEELNKKLNKQLIDDDHAWLAVNISVEECLALWRPWRRALIIKLLWKTVSPMSLTKGSETSENSNIGVKLSTWKGDTSSHSFLTALTIIMF